MIESNATFIFYQINRMTWLLKEIFKSAAVLKALKNGDVPDYAISVLRVLTSEWQTGSKLWKSMQSKGFIDKKSPLQTIYPVLRHIENSNGSVEFPMMRAIHEKIDVHWDLIDRNTYTTTAFTGNYVKILLLQKEEKLIMMLIAKNWPLSVNDIIEKKWDYILQEGTIHEQLNRLISNHILTKTHESTYSIEPDFCIFLENIKFI